MKLIFTLILVTLLVSCKPKQDQELNKLYLEYLRRQSSIDLIQYKLNRVDTFVTGQVWNNNGTATLERNNRDSIFKFSFFGKRVDLDRENIYINNMHFQIFPKTKTFRVEKNYGKHVLGAPGGQMVVEDLLNPDTLNSTINIVEKDDSSFLIKEKRILKSAIITKYLTISKITFLPLKIQKTVSDTVLNVKSSSTFIITDILIGDQVVNNELNKITLLSTYKDEIPIIDKTADVLIGQPIHDLMLKIFSNKDVRLKELKDKIVLLDFWELWCGPCLNSLPKINEFSKKYNSFNFVAIGITTSKMEDVNKYLSVNGIEFEQAQGNSTLLNYFKVNSYPQYVLIDKKGIVRFIYYGFSEDIESKIKSLI